MFNIVKYNNVLLFALVEHTTNSYRIIKKSCNDSITHYLQNIALIFVFG